MIPHNDIKINPSLLEKNLLNEMEFISTGLNNEDEERIKKIFSNGIKNIIHNNYFWYLITGNKICTHRYKNSKKYNGNICGKPIYSKHENIKEGEWLCSRHLPNHLVERPRKLKEDQINCKAITINGDLCKYSAKINGYCSQHYQIVNNLDILDVHEEIKKNKKLNIIKNNTNIYECKIYNNYGTTINILENSYSDYKKNDNIKLICYKNENEAAENNYYNYSDDSNSDNSDYSIDSDESSCESSDEEDIEEEEENIYRHFYVDHEYIEKYNTFLMEELGKLKNIECKINRCKWIVNIFESIEYFCIVPSKFLIYMDNNINIDEDKDFVRIKDRYLKPYDNNI